MKHLSMLAVAALVLASCDVESGDISFGEPSHGMELDGVWSGVEQISTAQENSAFSFPIVLQLDRGRFTLYTSNYPAAYDDQWDRTCSGVYTRSANRISFFPRESCRALPLNSFTLGRTLPAGITMQASTSSIVSSMGNYVSIRVVMRLDRE